MDTTACGARATVGQPRATESEPALDGHPRPPRPLIGAQPGRNRPNREPRRSVRMHKAFSHEILAAPSPWAASCVRVRRCIFPVLSLSYLVQSVVPSHFLSPSRRHSAILLAITTSLGCGG